MSAAGKLPSFRTSVAGLGIHLKFTSLRKLGETQVQFGEGSIMDCGSETAMTTLSRFLPLKF